VWRIVEGQASRVGPVSAEAYGIQPGAYVEGAGLLVQTSGPDETDSDGGADLPLVIDTVSSAAVTGLDGTGLRYIWPQR